MTFFCYTPLVQWQWASMWRMGIRAQYSVSDYLIAKSQLTCSYWVEKKLGRSGRTPACRVCARSDSFFVSSSPLPLLYTALFGVHSPLRRARGSHAFGENLAEKASKIFFNKLFSATPPRKYNNVKMEALWKLWSYIFLTQNSARVR